MALALDCDARSGARTTPPSWSSAHRVRAGRGVIFVSPVSGGPAVDHSAPTVDAFAITASNKTSLAETTCADGVSRHDRLSLGDRVK